VTTVQVRHAARTAARAILLLALVGVAACADIATAPVPIVRLDGSVRYPNGDPVVGAELYFTTPPPRNAPIPVAHTSAQGTFSLDLPAITYNLYIYPPSSSGLPGEGYMKVRVPRRGGRFDYQYTGVEVSGSVTGPTGEALTNAYVRFESLTLFRNVETRTTGGQYRAYVLPGLQSILVEDDSDYSGIPSITRSITVRADTTIDFALTGHLVTGLVTGPEGSPLPSAEIVFVGGDARSGAFADALGNYRLYAPTGVYEAYALPPLTRRNIVSRRFPALAIAGPTTDDLALTGITWRGTARVRGSGATIAGASVSAYSFTDGGYGQAVSDSTGAFELYVKSPAEYRLTASSDHYQLWDGITAIAIADSTFDLYLDPVPVGAPRRTMGDALSFTRPPTPALRAGPRAAR